MFRAMLAVVMLCLCGAAVADNYVGVGVGQLRIEESGFDADDVALKLFGGWRFNESLALEVAYINGGKPENSFGLTSVRVEPRAVQVSAIGTLPITEAFGVYARAGLMSWKAETFAADDLNRSTVKTDGEDFAWGIGTSVAIGSTASVRFEYEGADLDGTDLSVIMLSGVLRFGAD